MEHVEITYNLFKNLWTYKPRNLEGGPYTFSFSNAQLIQRIKFLDALIRSSSVTFLDHITLKYSTVTNKFSYVLRMDLNEIYNQTFVRHTFCFSKKQHSFYLLFKCQSLFFSHLKIVHVRGMITNFHELLSFLPRESTVIIINFYYRNNENRFIPKSYKCRSLPW